jgi:hypothetical protein
LFDVQAPARPEPTKLAASFTSFKTRTQQASSAQAVPSLLSKFAFSIQSLHLLGKSGNFSAFERLAAKPTTS